MNNAARKVVCDIVARYGQPSEEHASRFEALLRDFCPKYPAELFVLLSSLEQRVVWELLSSRGTLPWAVLQARLTRKLQDALALEEEAAHWAVETWALALNIISPRECCPLPPPIKRIQQQASVLAPVPNAEYQLRTAVRQALADGVIDKDEKEQLRGLRRLLNIPRLAASQIYLEVKADHTEKDCSYPSTTSGYRLQRR